MSRSTKSYEERLLEMERREQESLEKAKRYAAQKRELQWTIVKIVDTF